MKNINIPPKISLLTGIVLIFIGLIVWSIFDLDIEVADLYEVVLVFSIILFGFILAIIGFAGVGIRPTMTTQLTAIIIVTGATITWIIVLLVLGALPFLLSLFGFLPMVIWLIFLIYFGLTSGLRALAWTFILIGIFFLFFPFTLHLPDVVEASLVPFILICVGINFAFGLLSAIISFLKKKF